MEKSSFSFSISYSWSFAFSFRQPAKGHISTTAEDRPHPSSLDDKEAFLSLTTLHLQRRIRERARGGSSSSKEYLADLGRKRLRERLLDVRSLQLLEAATATKSASATSKDRGSLKVLLYHTTKENMPRPTTFVTPERASFWPEDRRPKPKQYSSLTDAAPFTTPSSVERELKARPGHGTDTNRAAASNEQSVSISLSISNKAGHDEPTNEFEAYLRNPHSISLSGSTRPSRKYMKSFSADFEWYEASAGGAGQPVGSGYIRDQASTVFKAMDKAKQADGHTGVDGDDSTTVSESSSHASDDEHVRQRSDEVVAVPTSENGKTKAVVTEVENERFSKISCPSSTYLSAMGSSAPAEQVSNVKCTDEKDHVQHEQISNCGKAGIAVLGPSADYDADDEKEMQAYGDKELVFEEDWELVDES